jgi:carboxypeptidase Q
MRLHKLFRIQFALLLCFALPLSLSAADKNKAATDTDKPSYELPQPARENLDYTMYQRIREEGLAHSHVMDFASALMDGIGPRLTGSPNVRRANEWTRDQLTAMGCTNAHLEDWGEFGMGWQQLNTWVRMTSPDTAVFIAQASPWSPSSNGTVSGQAVSVVIKEEKDLDQYKGKLGGKIVLLGDMRDVKPSDKALFTRMDDKDLAKVAEYPLEKPRSSSDWMGDYIKRMALLDKTAKFLAAEHVVAVILPSRDGRDNGGSGGTIFDDGGLGWATYKREHANPVPVVVAAIENYGRVFRLLKANVPVSLELNVDVKYVGDHEHGFDTIAEIPGTDPKLKDEVVMVGGTSRLVGIGNGGYRQRRRHGGGDGSDANSQRAASQAAAHHPHRTVDRRRAGTFWLDRLCAAAFRIRAALHRSRSTGEARVDAQARRPARPQT